MEGTSNHEKLHSIHTQLSGEIKKVEDERQQFLSDLQFFTSFDSREGGRLDSSNFTSEQLDEWANNVQNAARNLVDAIKRERDLSDQRDKIF